HGISMGEHRAAHHIHYWIISRTISYRLSTNRTLRSHKLAGCTKAMPHESAPWSTMVSGYPRHWITGLWNGTNFWNALVKLSTYRLLQVLMSCHNPMG